MSGRCVLHHRTSSTEDPTTVTTLPQALTKLIITANNATGTVQSLCNRCSWRCVQHLDGVAEASQHEKQLYNMLLHGYSKHVRPVKHYADPVRVRVAFSLVEVLSIDENNGQMVVKAWLTMASHILSSFKLLPRWTFISAACDRLDRSWNLAKQILFAKWSNSSSSSSSSSCTMFFISETENDSKRNVL